MAAVSLEPNVDYEISIEAQGFSNGAIAHVKGRPGDWRAARVRLGVAPMIRGVL